MNILTATGPVERGARLSFLITSLVVITKLVGAAVSHSVSVTAEALQSGVDVFVSFAIFQTVRIAARPADEDHPYGHGKAEALVSAAQTMLIFVSCAWIIYEALGRLLRPSPIEASAGLIVMLIAIGSDFILSVYLAAIARKHNSAALASEVLHLRGDLFSGLGIVVGLTLVLVTKQVWLDPVVAIIFTGITVVLAIRQFGQTLHSLMDGSLPEPEIAKVREVLQNHPSAMDYHYLRTRQAGAHRFVELHLLLEDELSFIEAHDLTEEIESELSAALDGAIVNIHYEPYRAEMAHRAEKHPAENS
ncbi:MAG: cation transporter [Armatimonadetes bacterium]|nr:cation transporter [Armatimonadota bacterium]